MSPDTETLMPETLMPETMSKNKQKRAARARERLLQGSPMWELLHTVGSGLLLSRYTSPVADPEQIDLMTGTVRIHDKTYRVKLEEV